MAEKKPEVKSQTSPAGSPASRVQGWLDHLDGAMGGAMAGYQEARDGLREHHGKMDAAHAKHGRRADALGKQVDAFLHGDQRALTPEIAQTCLEYLDAAGKQAAAFQARRIAYPAVRPVGEAAPGGAIGDPPGETT